MKPVENEVTSYVQLGHRYILNSLDGRRLIVPQHFVECDDPNCSDRGNGCSGQLFEDQNGEYWHDVEADFIEVDEDYCSPDDDVYCDDCEDDHA